MASKPIKCDLNGPNMGGKALALGVYKFGMLSIFSYVYDHQDCLKPKFCINSFGNCLFIFSKRLGPFSYFFQKFDYRLL